MLLTSLILAPIALATLIGIFNLLTWPRRLQASAPPPAISVLIPARNEEANIEDCVRSVAAAAAAHPGLQLEIIVYDDHSTDRTSEILRTLASEIPTLRLPEARPLPAGWAGKCHACHQLASHANHPNLLFIDADVRLLPDAFTGLAAWQQRYNADVVSAVPAQVTGSFFEHLILPLLHLTYLSWLPLLLIPHSRRADFLAMNGQILMCTREAYDRIGGFEAIRDALVDDMAFGRRAKEAGLTVAFADGTHLAQCRMYRDAPSVWEGFTKNIYPGMGKNPALLLLVIALYFCAFVLPFILLPLTPIIPSLAPLTTPLIAAVALNLVYRTLLAVRFSHPPLSVLLHPLGVLALIAIALNSYRQTLRGQLTWAGRTYPNA
ncbi:glycosyltransferase [Lujinxingia vulgaris]|uniref:Glycosyltransferase n=1 Tax=Lujinxingia vulgaris TaxID=2600176 RepID=A0A5C6XG40_9DELT|nr:glycosyltransferase [Lujinxingia vulgaris]TXD37158.1 glycosyltransferase [Lujinxingia vulgaris]